jgi:alanyl-tRNA synthetase
VTHRLYYTDAYLREFEATVTHHTDDGKRIYLDRTAFYPTSGGQPYDTGQLSGAKVIDVVDEGEEIAHVLTAPLADERVVGRIDWPRRFDHMQQHTGQHVLSAVLAELIGRSTLGVHFGDETSTVDLDGEPLSAAEIAQVESRVNEVVTDNRTVEVGYQEADLAEGLRKPSTRRGTLRIVTIQDLDRSACGGTHVRRTGEIGTILLRKPERVRTGIRLEFVCGGRAVRQVRSDYDVLTQVTAKLTASAAELPQLIQRLQLDLKTSRVESQELRSEVDRLRARELYSSTAPGPDGIRRVLCREDSGPLDRLKGLGQAVASMPLAVFVGATSQPPAVIVAASKDSGMDAGRALKGLLANSGGRGGGSASLAQGVLPEAGQLEGVIHSLLHPRPTESM